MSLFATINFFGALIEPKNSNNFEQKLKAFLTYAKREYTIGKQKLLSSIYRHGLMHSFFTKVSGTEIFFVPDNTSTDMLSISDDTITLNVMALYRVVSQTFYKLSASLEARNLMQRNIPAVLNMREDSVTLIEKLRCDGFKID
ncbi:hypothetical protein [Dyadobacter arcticus]|uniref:Uncharacterized protein n=1 Tax=Dyadobacter arcticus TaxID=1078754 RepID=A0ABX0URV6_9BACT|nr:hypothetical protein [Dyadobacter arcticus]NIJ54654.1 hypothetical protein [Dyadobacter arcticus]